ncbi:MAG: orotate phosphoribosyltransferase [Cryobacterium sp.]|nr:orotate phosphoribosyltransferase [Oligoflexia bacterium]
MKKSERSIEWKPDFHAPIEFAAEKEKLRTFIRERSYREGDFTLASGKKSTFYIDMKAATLAPAGAFLIGRLAYQLLTDKLSETEARIEGVGGLTLGADPIATAVSLAAYAFGAEWPAFIVRKEAKGHGTGRFVEGRENLADGAEVIVLEDVVTTGGSSVKAIERLRAEGYQPIAVLTVVDREEGGAAAFAALGIPLYSLLTIRDLRSGA